VCVCVGVGVRVCIPAMAGRARDEVHFVADLV
jgi:hypothetical protein